MPHPVDPPALRALIASQDGVVARWQAEEHGLRARDIARRLRRGLWVRHSPGVYLTHTGGPTWRQRAWMAVLAVWPAALRGRSALHAAEGAPEDGRTISSPLTADGAVSRTRPAPA